MINHVHTLTGWAMPRGVTREWSTRLIGWAETMRQLADKDGLTWNPPEPREMS